MRKALLVTVLASMGTLAGCKAETAASIVAVGLCSPPTDANTCSMGGRCSSFLAGEQWYYLRSARTNTLNGSLQYFMQFDNQALDNADDVNFRVNTHDAWLNEVSLSYSVKGSAATPAFSIPSVTQKLVPTLIRAGSNGTPVVPLIPAFGNDLVSRFAARITAGDSVYVTITVRGRGKFVDGSSFETGPYDVPVVVTNDLYEDSCLPGPLRASCPSYGQSGSRESCTTGSTCATPVTVGGSVTGLLAGGSVTLSTPGLSDVVVNANGTFEFATTLCDGDTFNVEVASAPAGQTCTVSNGFGTVGTTNVTDIEVTCF